MHPRSLLWITVACTALSAAAIGTIDRPVAEYVHRAGGIEAPFFRSGTVLIEHVFGWGVSKYLLGFLLAGAGLVMMTVKRDRLAFALITIGTSHVLARVIAGTLKNVFERVRPEELLQTALATGFFSADGNSFPSAHTAHFWSLFFPLALFCRRVHWIWALPVPIYIAVARVAVNDHFVSDVLAGIAAASLVTWGVQAALRRRFTISPVQQLPKDELSRVS
jgi:membrane-associated phospholipid phosphatase